MSTQTAPGRSRAALIVGLVLAAALLAFIAFAVWMGVERMTYEDACRDLGGVPVKSHAGPIVCIDPDSLIEVPES